MKDKEGLGAKILGLIFVLLVLIVFTSGMVSTIFFPDELSEYENRYANKLVPFTASAYLDGSFQSGMEAALGDQVDMASTFKRVFNQVSSNIYRFLLKPFLKLDFAEQNYFKMKTNYVFDGEYLVMAPYDSSRRSDIDKTIESYNRLFERWPNVEFYVYYVERSLDINLKTGEKAGLCDYFFNGLNLPDDNKACFSVDSYEQFQNSFFKTDHHWNYSGAHRGYEEVLKLLDCDDTALEPRDLVSLPGDFHGSFARGDLSCYSETFMAYTYNYPAMSYTVDAFESSGYGNQDYYICENIPVKAYGNFYGLDNGEVIFSTGRPERENLLIIGDSYDNAISKLIASHFNTTYSVDPRNYEVYLYKPFSFSHYMNECGIDKVLLLGNFDTFISPEFILGD